MTASDDEFEDFLKRRKPVFRAPDDMFEPPEELDRVVLRQAREAIETPRPLRVFRGPRWATPVALAATLVLGVTVVFQAGMPQKGGPVAEVTVQNVTQRVDYPEAAPAMAPAPAAANNQARAEADASGAGNRTANNAVVVDLAPQSGGLVAREEAERYAAPPPATAPAMARAAADAAGERRDTRSSMEAPSVLVSTPAAKSTELPTWRRDSKTWLAEIERLRDAGDIARADAELAEYKRQQRAYAVAPDR